MATTKQRAEKAVKSPAKTKTKAAAKSGVKATTPPNHQLKTNSSRQEIDARDEG